MFRARLVSGLLLAAAFAATFFMEGWSGAIVFSIFIAFLAYVGAKEFLFLCSSFGYPGYPKLTGLFAVLLIAADAAGGILGSVTGGTYAAEAFEAFVLTLFLVLGFRQVFRNAMKPASIMQLFISLAGLIYICWTLGFIPKLFFSAGLGMEGRWLAFFLVAVTKAGDIGAYTVGMITSKRPGGNHKVMPSVSPKKSWEGFIGGTVFGLAVALLLVWRSGGALLLDSKPVVGYGGAVGWALFFAVLGFWGDVAESALKRAANVKNSGALPGLGGVLDVLDSLILVTPFFYAYVRLAAALGV